MLPIILTLALCSYMPPRHCVNLDLQDQIMISRAFKRHPINGRLLGAAPTATAGRWTFSDNLVWRSRDMRKVYVLTDAEAERISGLLQQQ